MTSQTQKLRPLVEETRLILLDLHKKLIDIGRSDFEKTNGPIASPYDWVPILVGHPFFSFLHPLSQLITSLDELLEITWPLREIDILAVRAEIENMIGDFKTTPQGFRTHYLEMIQRESEVVLLHSKLKTALQKFPTIDYTKMLEYLNIRQQWTTATKLKRPTGKPGNS